MRNRTSASSTNRIRRIVIGAAALGALVILCAMAGFFWLARQVDAAGVGDPPRQTDAIVILGALVRPNGEPGRDLYARTRWAVSLFKERTALGEDPGQGEPGAVLHQPVRPGDPLDGRFVGREADGRRHPQHRRTRKEGAHGCGHGVGSASGVGEVMSLQD